MNELDQTIIGNESRLHRIKAMIDEGEHKNLVLIRNKVKGSAVLYTVLLENNIVYKNKTDKLVWAENIPVTKVLANTLTKELRKRNRAYTTKVKANTISLAAEKIEKVPFKLDTVKTEPVEIVRPRRSKRVKVVEEKQTSKLTVTFAWGLFKYIRS